MGGDDPVFEALIVPHRSLSRRGLNRVAACLAAFSLTLSVLLWAAGAWPVIGFAGAEAALAIWLFRRHAFGPAGDETLTLSAAGVRIVARDRRGKTVYHHLGSAWLRVRLEERAGRVPALLLLGGGGTSVEVAQALGEDQKRSLAAALQAALDELRYPPIRNPQLVNDE